MFGLKQLIKMRSLVEVSMSGNNSISNINELTALADFLNKQILELFLEQITSLENDYRSSRADTIHKINRLTGLGFFETKKLLEDRYGK